jgi:hypothetical protein
MSGYPLLEHEGFCASVTTKKEATARWMCWVAYARGHDASALADGDPASHRVPNDYPSEEKAVLAAYEYARTLISRELVRH